MKNITRILFITFYMIATSSIIAGVTEDQLEPYKKLLPSKLTPKEISEWPLETTYKKKKYFLDFKRYTIKLSSKEYKKLERSKKIRFKFGGYVKYNKEGKKPKDCKKGAVNIYLFSTEEPIKIVAHKKIRLPKFCPS